MKCKHKWKIKLPTITAKFEYYYCIHCLAEAIVYANDRTFTINESSDKTQKEKGK